MWAYSRVIPIFFSKKKEITEKSTVKKFKTKMLENIFFNLCVIGIIISSLQVVLSKNTVRSVLFLILIYVLSSFVLLLLGLEFLGLLYILIYVGAIAVLFLFVIMMLNIKDSVVTNRFNYKFYIFLICFFCYYLIFVYEPKGIQAFSDTMDFLINDINYINPIKQYQMSDSLALIGSKLYTEYFMVFIVSGLLLLISMIGSIALTLLIRWEGMRMQDGFHQIDKNFNQTIVLKTIKKN